MGFFSGIKAKIENERAIAQSAYEEVLNYNPNNNDECFFYAARKYFDSCNSNPGKARGYLNAFIKLLDNVEESTLKEVFDRYIGREDMKFKLALIPKLQRLGLIEKLETGGYKKCW